MSANPAPVVVALDVGGTLMKGAVVGADTHPREMRRWSTPRHQGPDAVVKQVLAAVDELVSAAPDARAIGLVVPGVVDEDAGVAVYSENIEWHNVEFHRLVTERTGLSVGFGHDVRAGGLAERELGAAQGSGDVLFMPIGTGISGAMFVGGHLVHNPYAGEIGHVYAGFDDPCACGARGCLEAVASGASIARRYQRLSGRAVDGARDVLELAQSGDAAAATVWGDALDALARVLVTYISILAPSRVVVGGGVSHAGEHLLGPLRERLRQRIVWQQEPELVTATLADEAGCLGAALLARRAFTRPKTPDVVPTNGR
ncbi:MAG: ROK family protein [Nocardioidaceae bacterium]